MVIISAVFLTFIPDLNDVDKGTSSQTKDQEDEMHSHSSASPNNAGGGVSPVSSFGLIVQEVNHGNKSPEIRYQ